MSQNQKLFYQYGFLLLLIHGFGCSCSAQFLQPLPPDHAPPGIRVDPVSLQIFILENNEVVLEPGPTSNLIAQFNSTTLPVLASLTPPNINLEIVEITEENGDGWADGYYLRLTSVLDYEGATKLWGVRLDIGSFVITVDDMNDREPEFISFPDDPIIVKEKEIPSNPLWNFTAKDDDSVDLNQLKFDFKDLQNEDDRSTFEIDPTTGVLTLIKTLDYQARTNYRLQISVTDSENLHTINAPIVTTINVEDIPDLPPLWSKFNYLLTIQENKASGEVIGTYEARDEDLGVNSEIKYTLSDVPTNPEGFPYLEIGEDTGILTISTGALDLEDGILKENFQIKIKATEVKPPFAELEGNITVVIQDENDNLPTFEDGASSKSFEIEINEGHVDRLPGLEGLIVIDTDTSLAFSSYSAEISDEELKSVFTISPAQGYGQTTFSLLVQPGFTIDYDKTEQWQNPIDFQIVFTDTANSANMAEALIKLTVKDINDITPEFTLDTTTGFIEFEIPENITNGARVGFVMATDGDISPEFGTPSLKYTWFNRDPLKLALNETTGEITVITENAFDYERIPDEYYMVQVEDMNGGEGALRSTAEVHIKITDINDQKPTITLETRDVILPENSISGTPVIPSFTVKDPDTDPNIVVSFTAMNLEDDYSRWFELVDNSDPETPNSKEYSIIVATGLPDNDLPDYEKVERIDITLIASDENTIPDKPEQKTSTELFTLIVTNINDVEPEFEPISQISVRETTEESGEEPDRRLIYQFRATDGDKGITTFEYSITSDYEEMLKLVNIEPATGILRRAEGEMIDRETVIIPGTEFTEKLIYKVTVSDGVHEKIIDFELTIEDVNDNAPIITNEQADYFVSEGEQIDYKVETFAATDKDAGSFGTISYFIDETFNSGIGTDLFQINQETGDLTVMSELDRETRIEYDLRILAKDNYRLDSTTNTNTGEKIIKIILTDINDRQPEFRDTSFPDIYENVAPVGTILGSAIIEDKDEPNSDNSEVSVTFEATCIDPPGCHEGMDPIEFFEAIWENPTYTIKSKNSFQGYYGTYEIEITAVDHGTPPQSTTENFRLIVLDVNDNTPEIIYPPEGIVYYLNETLPVGSALKEYYSPTPIPALQGTDKDDSNVGNGRVKFSINQTGNGYMYLEVDEVTNNLRVSSQLIVSETGKEYEIQLIASDEGTPQPLSTSRIVKFIVVPADNTPPYFLETSPIEIHITENNGSSSYQFPHANDPDIVEGGINIYNETVCYFLVEGGTETFLINSTTNFLSLAHGLDREEMSSHNLTIYSKNDLEADGCTVPNNPPTEGPSTLKILIHVDDVKDTPPYFLNEGPLISGGVKTTADVGSSTSIILRANDLDLNETLEFTISEDIYRSDPSLDTIELPIFKLNRENNELLVAFKPHDSMKGYFNFTVRVTDSVNEISEKPVKIYMITQKNVVEFKFLNPYAQFNKELEDSITTILNHAFSPFRANVDRSVPTTDENGATIPGQTTVETHFIDDEQNQPLAAVIITNKQYDEPDLISNLTAEFNAIGLNLDIFSYIKDPEPEPASILPYILMAIVGVLAIALIVLSLTCWFNTRSLSRRVRALTAETFGQADMDKHTLDVKDAFPNTNVHAISGSNPIWTEDPSSRQNQNFDTESIGSGGSVLIGVESDDDFKDYRANDNQNPMYQDEGEDNSSISSVEVNLGRNANMSSPFGGSVARRNPLMFLNDTEGNA